MPLSEFGPFASVFQRGELDVPGHLELLHLHDDGAQVVISRIEQALAIMDPTPSIRALLGSPNWRPHLVAAIAMLLQEGPPCCIDALWGAIDAGSWVTPQLVVAAMFLDTGFSTAARTRVADGCVIRPPVAMSPADQHSATEPSGTAVHSAKLTASLLAVSAHVPALSSWRASISDDREVQELLARDIDHSDRIATDWLTHLVRQFELRGRTLSLAGNSQRS
jgi:hypothetical protein